MSLPPKRKESLPVIEPDGLILMQVGMVFDINGHEAVCVVVDESTNSAVIRYDMTADGRQTLLACKTSKERVLSIMDESWMEKFLDGAVKLNQITDNQNQNTIMSKKKSSGGKIAFVDAALLSGKYTKSEIATALSTDFKVPAKTARNTVSWCASTIGTRHEGKESKHKPEVKSESAKPAKATKFKAAPKAKVKKSTAPKSKAPKKKVTAEAKAKTASEPVTA